MVMGKKQSQIERARKYLSKPFQIDAWEQCSISWVWNSDI